MGKVTRKRYGAEFKAKVALEAIRGEQTSAELSAKHGIHQTMIAAWKQQAIGGLALTFSGKAEVVQATGEAKLTRLLVEKHGAKTRRSWRKLHIGLDTDTGQVVAATLTNKARDDGAEVGPLLDQVLGPVASFTADGAYDQEGVSIAVAERHPEAAIIVPPRSTAVPSEAAATAPTQRDRHLQSIVEHGRAAWHKVSGYTKRARAEAAISRFKQVIGDGLRSRTDRRRATEVDVAVHALNRMLGLGRPISVRIA